MNTHPHAGLKLDAETESQLRRLAKARQCGTDQLVREAIEQYVKREEARRSFRQDALDAWADYQSTGLHVSGELADAWLEAGESAEPPPAHR